MSAPVTDPFVAAGVLTDGDARLAVRLAVLGGDPSDPAVLAVALLLRAVRQGSVLLDLEAAPDEVVVADDVGAADLAGLPWPTDWTGAVVRGPLVRSVLRTDGRRIWLARHWVQERHVAAELRDRATDDDARLDTDLLEAGLGRLFARTSDDDQRDAARTCLASRLTVLAGGPGTGKTTTVASVLALLREQHPGHRIALAAPTGKAAARLGEAVAEATAELPDVDRARAEPLEARTLHRLLGWRPDGRFRHDRHERLPFETVVVDEASMVPLTMMSRLLEALRPGTRLLLVGDPDQLASVDAGAVLADVVDAGTASGVRVATLVTNHRFAPDSGIARLAAAVRDGDADAAQEVLESEPDDLEVVPLADGDPLSSVVLAPVVDDVVAAAADRVAAARDGDRATALAALDRHRLLCAHRHGDRGASRWNDLAADWADPRHAQRPDDRPEIGDPLLVTANDYDAGLYNGDTGVVVAGRRGPVAAFGRGSTVVEVPLSRLGATLPLHAMTVHRSQGSQFDHVTVVLPPAGSSLSTRQTLYTAVTRARTRLRLVGDPGAVARAVATPAARATGLRERLRGEASLS